MVLVLDETVLRMAERAGRPVRCTDGGAAWGDLDVVQEVTVQGDRLVVTHTERGKTRVEFTTDDAAALDRYLLVQFGESMRMSRGLPIVLTAQYPPRSREGSTCARTPPGTSRCRGRRRTVAR